MTTKIITNKKKTSALLIQTLADGSIRLMAETPKLSHKAGRISLNYSVEEIRELAAQLIVAADAAELAARDEA